jgi:hypothetical protein
MELQIKPGRCASRLVVRQENPEVIPNAQRGAQLKCIEASKRRGFEKARRIQNGVVKRHQRNIAQQGPRFSRVLVAVSANTP